MAVPILRAWLWSAPDDELCLLNLTVSHQHNTHTIAAIELEVGGGGWLGDGNAARARDIQDTQMRLRTVHTDKGPRAAACWPATSDQNKYGHECVCNINKDVHNCVQPTERKKNNKQTYCGPGGNLHASWLSVRAAERPEQ
jgi:hypothetical protein